MNTLFFIALIIVGIEPAFLSKSFHGKYCLPEDEHTSVLKLKPNGPSSHTTFSMMKSGNTYIPGSNCSVLIEAADDQYLLLTFEVIDTRPCGEDSIRIETQSSNNTLCGSHKCPADNCPEFTFENNPNITIEFTSNPGPTEKVHGVGFLSTITAYSKAKPGQDCPGTDRFRCSNNRCIWEGLHCDGRNNCGDNSDEPPGCAKTLWSVLVIVLGLVSLCFFLPLFCYLAFWGPRRKVPIRIMGNTFFAPKMPASVNDEEAQPFLSGQPLQGSMPGETFIFYGATSSNNPRC